MIFTAAASFCSILAIFWLPASPTPVRMVERDGWSCNVEGTLQDSSVVSVARFSWLMGTELRAVVCADSRADGVAALEDAFAEIRQVESRLSTWIEDSELSRLNSVPPGNWVELSGSTLGLLEEVRDWTLRTDGAFDPAVGVLIDAWDMRGTGREPTAQDLVQALESTGSRYLEIDATRSRVRRLRAVRIDAGAFGKGAGLRAAAEALRASRARSAVLEFGGQIEIVSSAPNGARWTIEVADPVHRDRTVTRLRIGRASVATTGSSERFIEVDGHQLGHVIDPRNGHPIPAWGSVTVVAEDPVTADILSTALFVMGPEAAIDWSQDLDIGVLLLIDSGSEITMFRNDALIEMEMDKS